MARWLTALVWLMLTIGSARAQAGLSCLPGSGDLRGEDARAVPDPQWHAIDGSVDWIERGTWCRVQASGQADGEQVVSWPGAWSPLDIVLPGSTHVQRRSRLDGATVLSRRDVVVRWLPADGPLLFRVARGARWSGQGLQVRTPQAWQALAQRRHATDRAIEWTLACLLAILLGWRARAPDRHGWAGQLAALFACALAVQMAQSGNLSSLLPLGWQDRELQWVALLGSLALAAIAVHWLRSTAVRRRLHTPSLDGLHRVAMGVATALTLAAAMWPNTIAALQPVVLLLWVLVTVGAIAWMVPRGARYAPGLLLLGGAVALCLMGWLFDVSPMLLWTTAAAWLLATVSALRRAAQLLAHPTALA